VSDYEGLVALVTGDEISALWGSTTGAALTVDGGMTGFQLPH
jgi:hypothetical protein